MATASSPAETQPHSSAPGGPPELRRTLGFADLVLLNVVAVLNLNLVPVAAAGGFPSLGLWIVGLLFFFLPQGIAVAEFGARYPDEGGIYAWAKKCFGGFHGFLAGWCYWTNNVFYIPTLLFYLVGISVYVGGEEYLLLGEDPAFVLLFSLGLLWLFTALNIRGLVVGKWVNNLGGVCAVAATVMLVAVSVYVVRGRDAASAGLPAVSSLVPSFADWRTMSALSVICFGLVGLELGSVMGGEIKNPRRDVPRAALIGGVACAVLYLAATLALLLALPSAEISIIQGVLQAFQRMGAQAGLGWLLSPLALVLTLSIAGTAAAWMAGSARIPFVAGLDRYLPAALGRLHPRWDSPYVALLAHAVASSVFIAMSFLGAQVKEAYLTMLQLAVFIQLVPFLYLYAGLFRVAGTPGGHFRGKWMLLAAGAAGLVTTAAAMATSFVPAEAIESVWKFELKMIAGTTLFLGAAWALFLRATRRRG